MSCTRKVIVGLCGGHGQGKRTMARVLQAEYGFHKIAIGDRLRQELGRQLNCCPSLLEDETPVSQAFCNRFFYLRKQGVGMSLRTAMSLYDEWIRETLGSKCWVSLATRQIQQAPNHASVVVPDITSTQEANFLSNAFGDQFHLVQVVRNTPYDPKWRECVDTHDSRQQDDVCDSRHTIQEPVCDSRHTIQNNVCDSRHTVLYNQGTSLEEWKESVCHWMYKRFSPIRVKQE